MTEEQLRQIDQASRYAEQDEYAVTRAHIRNLLGIIDGPTSVEWRPIEEAPMDGRPVWVMGNNWGEPAKGTHQGWAYWDGMKWVSAGADGTVLTFLTKWMPEAAKS